MLQLAVTCEMRNGHYTTNIPGSNHGKRLVFWRSLRSTTLESTCVRQSSKGTSIPPTEDLSPFSTMQPTIQFIYMLSIHWNISLSKHLPTVAFHHRRQRSFKFIELNSDLIHQRFGRTSMLHDWITKASRVCKRTLIPEFTWLILCT